ncbi:uncharacterized protein LOC142345105 [Convolutriloba macropyga]|uniref:uncharacterized protein LOC142345105 n=1 Tax=Convolutriloba macropyga TaxID=536237 RepID=UPI003F51E10F
MYENQLGFFEERELKFLWCVSDEYDNLQEQKPDRDCGEWENGSLTGSIIAIIEEENALDPKLDNKKSDQAVPFACFSTDTGQDAMKEVQGASSVENTSITETDHRNVLSHVFVPACSSWTKCFRHLNLLEIPSSVLRSKLQHSPNVILKRGLKSKAARKASRAKLRNSYRKFRERLLKRAESSKSYRRLKDVYSDKRVGDSGASMSQMTTVQRMKFLFTHYGKVFIPLHYIVLSLFWFTACYAAVYLGFDLTPMLDKLPQKVKDSLHVEKLSEYKQTGIFIQAFALYKILTPVRYLSSISGTMYIVKLLRTKGYFITPPSMKEVVKKNYFRQRQNLNARRKSLRSRFNSRRKK